MKVPLKSQEQILMLLKQLNHAVSAQEIYIELRSQKQGLGLATIYRILKTLKLQGMIRSRSLSSGEDLYSLVEQDKHYLNCLQCGQSEPLDECPVHELEAQLHFSGQFEIYYHTLEFFGLCSSCQHQSGVEV
jgi:Fur family ferric uptake transcriptional regulator